MARVLLQGQGQHARVAQDLAEALKLSPEAAGDVPYATVDYTVAL
jgi:hypothetical protein